MSVTATARLSPVFPGFARQSSPSPARSDRAETSEADRDEFPRDGCHMCGMPRSEMPAHEHGEGVCNQRPIACPLCAKTFTLWSHYETHKKCHQKLKQRQYPCQSCGKIITSASNRNMHQRIHKGVRPFQCIPCGVFFRQKAHLQKHQRTQGHIQATELYEKRKAEWLIGTEEGKKEELVSGGSSGSSPRSEDSRQGGDSSSGPEEEGVSASTSPQHKNSPSQYSPPAGEEGGGRQLSRDQQICMNIEYNNITHGYECRQCDFGTHDHAMMKEHVATDHLREKADLQCKECMVTFTKPFNLKIHIRKHETSSQFLPCEYCEQVFKVPNKLIKHMEGVHSVCPTCGEKNSDKAGLQEHMEKVHNEPKKGVHANLQHLSSLASLHPTKQRLDLDNRHTKMRKLDSLAEHIRAKQLQNATGTNAINGNESKPFSPPDTQLVIRTGRRKSDMSSVQALLHKRPENYPFSRPGLESLVNQLNKIHGQPLLKSENNNILSSLTKMTEFPAHHHLPPRYPEPHPEADLTPPVSPPHSSPDSFTRIGHSNSGTFVLNNNPITEPESDDSHETGLDLTVKKEPTKSDENEVSTTERAAGAEPGRHLINTSFPYIVPSLPFLTRMPLTPLPHHNSSFTEHLFKLASISRPAVAALPQDLSKPTTSLAGHPSVLSAMLGHSPAPV